MRRSRLKIILLYFTLRFAVYTEFGIDPYLEDVFVLFHSGRPDGFRGHSLSVSDVVEVEDAASMTPGFYFCDSVGFKEIPFQPELASDVVIRPPTIQVVLVEPGKLARIAEVGITLESMQ